MVTQVAVLDTQEDAANIAYGLRKRITSPHCKAVHSEDGIITIVHSRTTISRAVIAEIDAFVEGYRLALELV